MDMLTLSHVSKRFGANQVIDDLNFKVPAHEAYRIVGLATQNSEFMAPAVSTMYQYIIEHYKQKDEVDV